LPAGQPRVVAHLAEPDSERLARPLKTGHGSTSLRVRVLSHPDCVVPGHVTPASALEDCGRVRDQLRAEQDVAVEVQRQGTGRIQQPEVLVRKTESISAASRQVADVFSGWDVETAG